MKRAHLINNSICYILWAICHSGVLSLNSILPQEYLFFRHYEEFLNFDTVLDFSLNSPLELSEYCMSSLREIKNAVERRNYWALELKDSWGRVPEGILSGHLVMLGDMEECIGDNLPGQSGKYCLLTIELPKLIRASPRPSNQVPAWGTCFPSDCTDADVSTTLVDFLKKLTNGTTTGILESCYTASAKSLDFWDYFMIGTIVFFVVIVVLATALDVMMKVKSRLLLGFSLPSNLRKWDGISRRSGRLEFLNGLRCISNGWAILCHMFMGVYFGYVWNANTFQNRILNPPLLVGVIWEAVLGVDTFLIIGACLISYKLVQFLDQNPGGFNPLDFLLQRYLRLTPLYLFVIGIYATLMPSLATGTQRSEVEAESVACRQNSWRHILYISNFQVTGPFCLRNSWYLAVDMQFYLIAPTLVYLIWKWKRVGMSTLILLVLTSVVLTCTSSYRSGINPLTMDGPVDDFAWEMYTRPWYRFAPYGIGLLCGYVLAEQEKGNYGIPRRVFTLGWIGSTITALSVLLVPWEAKTLSAEPVGLSFIGAVCAGSTRAWWGLTISWIIIALANNCGSWINQFLSHRIFCVLSPTVYGVYLFNTLPWMYRLRAKQPIYYDEFELTINFFGYLVLLQGIGVVCHLFVELPMAGVTHFLIANCKKLLKLGVATSRM